MLKTQPFLNMPRSLLKYSILHYIDLSLESMCMKLYWISGLDFCTLLWDNKHDDQTDNILEIYCTHQFEFFVHRLPGYLIYRIDLKLKLWTPSYGSRPMDQWAIDNGCGSKPCIASPSILPSECATSISFDKSISSAPTMNSWLRRSGVHSLRPTTDFETISVNIIHTWNSYFWNIIFRGIPN